MNEPSKPVKPDDSSFEGSPGVPKAAMFFGALAMLFLGGMILFAAAQWKDTESPGSVGVVEPKKELPKDWIKSFELNERSGKTVGSADLEGKVWVANFFFSTCPGSCRQQTLLVSGLERDFRDDGVRFVSITCDPKVDTVSKLAEYAKDFNAPDDWWFLTGDLLYIRRIAAEFFTLSVTEKGHQDRLAVVDKWGKVRGRYNWHDELQMAKLQSLVKELVAETESPEGDEGGDGGASSSQSSDSSDNAGATNTDAKSAEPVDTAAEPLDSEPKSQE